MSLRIHIPLTQFIFQLSFKVGAIEWRFKFLGINIKCIYWEKALKTIGKFSKEKALDYISHLCWLFMTKRIFLVDNKFVTWFLLTSIYSNASRSDTLKITPCLRKSNT